MRCGDALFVLLLLVGSCGSDKTVPPLFPDDYGATYTEVRNCRRSADHDLNYIRVLADPSALPVYRDRLGTFPEGAVLLKEEYAFDDSTCTGAIQQWSVMVRRPVSETQTLGWKWQRVNSARGVVSADNSRCYSCHEMCGVAPDGFAATCAVP